MKWPIPPSETQVSTVDSDGCVSFATTHAIESQRIFHGDDTEYSERALAKLSGTSDQGNFVKKVFQTIWNPETKTGYGMIPESLWPERFPFTWSEFYADIPQNVTDAGKDFLSKYNVTFENDVPLANLSAALEKGPVLAVLQGPGMNHIVTLLDTDLIIDSYPHSHDANGVINYTEKLSDLKARGVSIQSLHQILITPKNTMQLIRDNGTIFLVSTDKSSKIGIGNADVLTSFFPTEQVTDEDTSHIPQTGTLADGVILHK